MLPDNLISVSGPTEPVSLAEMNTHLRLNSGHGEETFLTTLITVAREYVETRSWRTVPSRTFDYYLAEFPTSDIVLPRPPVSSVTSVKYYDADNVQQTLASSTYEVVTWQQPGRIALAVDQSWPAVYDRKDAVIVRYVAGAASVSEEEKAVIKAVCAHFYEHRDYSPDQFGSISWPATIERLINTISVREVL